MIVATPITVHQVTAQTITCINQFINTLLTEYNPFTNSLTHGCRNTFILVPLLSRDFVFTRYALLVILIFLYSFSPPTARLPF